MAKKPAMGTGLAIEAEHDPYLDKLRTAPVGTLLREWPRLPERDRKEVIATLEGRALVMKICERHSSAAAHRIAQRILEKLK